jgi:hypothetical protein
MRRKYRVIRDNGKFTVKFEPSINKKLRVFKELGKIAVNIGLLTFTSLVLGSMIKSDYDRLSIIWIGGGITALLITVGLILLTAGGEKWNH